MQAVRVEFIPERLKSNSGKHYTRALVDSGELEWIELPASAEDSMPGIDDDDTGGTGDGTDSGSGGGSDSGTGSNPL